MEDCKTSMDGWLVATHGWLQAIHGWLQIKHGAAILWMTGSRHEAKLENNENGRDAPDAMLRVRLPQPERGRVLCRTVYTWVIARKASKPWKYLL